MYVVSDAVLDVIPPATFVLIRYLVALPVLFAALRISRGRGIQRSDWPKLALTAFVGFGVSLLAQFAGPAQHGGGGRVDHQCDAGVYCAICVVVLREVASGRQWLGLALATGRRADRVAAGRSTGDGGSTRSAAGRSLPDRGGGGARALYSVMVKIHTRTYSALAITLAVTAFGVPMVAPVAAIELQTQTIGVIAWPVLAGILYVGVG